MFTDHLGSLTAVINAETDSVTRYSYNAWGRARDPQDWTRPYEGELFAGRGYTGHEHLQAFSLINMNGRVYDPVLARFLSPDPFVQAPGYANSFNRYAYVMNNPLMFTDPSGYKSTPRWLLWWWFIINKISYMPSKDGTKMTVGNSGDGGGNGEGVVFSYSPFDPWSSNSSSNTNSPGGGLGGRTGGGSGGGLSRNENAGNLENDPPIVECETDRDPSTIINREDVTNSIPIYTSYLGAIGQFADLTLLEYANTPTLINISSTTRWIGWTGELFSISMSAYNFSQKPSPGNFAKLQTTIGIAGVNATPAGPMGSFAISIIDNMGAYNWYYDTLDNIYEKSGLYVIPPGLFPLPIIIPGFDHK